MNPMRAASTVTLLALLGALALLPATALARAADRNQPMTLDADNSDCNLADTSGKCVFSGNVVITQGTLDVRADRAEVSRANGEISQVVLTGRQATMKQQMDDGTVMNARADKIVYEPQKQVLTLTGNFQLESPRGTNTGQRMVYNMGTGQMQSGGDGTRVRTVIQPRAPAAGSGN